MQAHPPGLDCQQVAILHSTSLLAKLTSFSIGQDGPVWDHTRHALVNKLLYYRLEVPAAEAQKILWRLEDDRQMNCSMQ